MASMSSRERVVRAIEMTGPDRVPLIHVTLPGALAHFGADLARLYARYPADVVSVGAASDGEWGPQREVPSRDSWGALWVRHTDEHKGQVVHSPLADWDALAAYVPPDSASDAILDAVRGRIAASGGDLYTLADGDTLWQRMFYMHGYQSTLMDLVLSPERCADLRDMILRVMRRRVMRLCQVRDLDGLQFRDDWGTQQALMISPRLWRSFFKPAYAELFTLVRDAGKHVWFHSDGVIEAIIPDLVEIGVQVLNPQVDVMGRERVAELCAGKICIEGDIDRQWLLPFGSPEAVREAVRADVAAFGCFGGGYIGRGEMAGDVPLGNLAAMLDEYGKAVYRGTAC